MKMLMNKLQQERLMASLVAAASAETSLAITVDYVKQRELFGQTLGAFQNTQFTLAEVASEVQIGRCFIDQLILAHMKGENIQSEVSMAKYWVTEMDCRITSKCLQQFGGYGYCEEYLISRMWTDSRLGPIYAGTSEVMKMLISRGLGL